MELKDIVGRIFYTSWGYDQTNYDYVVVDKLSPTGKTAKCRLAKYKNEGTEGVSNIQKPVPEGYGLPFRLKVEMDKGIPSLRGSYPFISNQADDKDRSMKMGSFWLAEKDETFNETDPIFGH